MAVTEGTFPSHLELSKSRSQLAGLAAGPSSGPSPRTVATQTHGGVCAADAGLGGSQKPCRTRDCGSQLCERAAQVSPSPEAHLCPWHRACHWGSQLEHHCLLSQDRVYPESPQLQLETPCPPPS